MRSNIDDYMEVVRTKYRAKPVRKKTNVQNMPQLELFLRALAELYPRDKLAPGVHLAFLPADNKFYASVKRYNSHDPKDFETLFAVKEESALAVISALIRGWYDRNKHSIALLRKRGK